MTVRTPPMSRRTVPQPSLIRNLVKLWAAVGLVCSGMVMAQATPAPEPQADPLLAERLADLASESLQNASLSTAMYRQAGALLEAASRLAPSEPRFHRLRYEAYIQAGEIDNAVNALVAYARLDTTDLQAQARLIELYAQQMETAEQKLKYLRQDLLGAPTIPSEIRSHAALLAARVLLERGERSAAAKLANEATRLNGLNAEAQRLNFELSLVHGTPLDRLSGLLAIVRASPLDYRAITAVAEALSQNGIDESWQWYEAALELSRRNGEAPDRGVLLDYASRLMSAGYIEPARQLVEAIVKADPDDVGAHFLRLSLDRIGAEPQSNTANQNLARTSLTNALISLAQGVGINATTMPVETVTPFAPPSPTEIANKVLASDRQDVRNAYVISATELAWLYLYYLEEDPNRVARARELIEGLKLVLPADSVLLARLEGWLYLIEGKEAEARLKLAAVESEDGLAALGMLRLEKDPLAAATRARGIRSNFSHGVSGAIAAAEITKYKPTLILTTLAEQMRLKLEGYPTQLLRLIDKPQDYYFLRAEPLTSSVEYGQPVLVRVSLVNTSPLDLPLGPMGAIRNDLWFDAQIRGLRPASYPSTAFDRLAGPLVLRPRQSASRVVRFDQGRLLAYLRTTPYFSIPMTGTVMTNPAVIGERVGAGAGGYEVQFTRIVEQSNIPMSTADTRRALFEGLKTAPSARRLGLIDATVFAHFDLKRQEKPDPDTLAMFRSAIDALATDPDLTARSWGTFWVTLLSEGPARAEKGQAAAQDPYWLVRMLSLVGLRSGDAATYRAAAFRLSQDPEPIVSRFARAVLDEIEEAQANAAGAATQPASRP